jgi:CheY-like chemotaxis protein
MNAEPSSGPHATAPLVLVAEDDVLIRAVLAEALRDAGFRVVEAGSGDEAIDYIHSGAPLDLVVSDIEMPGKTDGIGLAQLLQRELPHLPIILTSGGLRSTSKVPFFSKPYDINQLIARISKILKETPGD